MKIQIASIAALLAASGCQVGEGTADVDTPLTKAESATSTGEACPDVGDKAYFFWMEPRSAEPGDKVSLSPYWTDMPGGFNSLPPGCLGGLDVYPEGAATFERLDDGRVIATITDGVEPGTRVRLNGTYRGHGLSGVVEIYRKDENPLVGRWRQREEDCPDGKAIRELVFTGAGDFSVTWTPFEAYKDYWGVYEYDATSNAFRFAVEGGNQIPEDIYEQGTVIMENGQLNFGQVFFGTPVGAARPCAANFVK